jgi:hypothetical protein
VPRCANITRLGLGIDPRELNLKGKALMLKSLDALPNIVTG